MSFCSTWIWTGWRGKQGNRRSLHSAPVEMTIFPRGEIVRFQELSAELQIPRLRSG
jgi:hypothetical protein